MQNENLEQEIIHLSQQKWDWMAEKNVAAHRRQRDGCPGRGVAFRRPTPSRANGVTNAGQRGYHHHPAPIHHTLCLSV